ncbi:MAG: DNA polymerase III subunit gamma/tau [Bacteroidales bacterium]|nr:DNA polymerase III subunit gamma/tau [Bacteroidales bacterium]
MKTNNFIVSARKYRPATFDTVVGQGSVTNTLKNAIKNNHLAQAYLFCGPRGVGKTTCARILAKTLNCFHMTPDIEACDECESCRAFNESRSYNIHELDAASNNSVDDIRNLIDQVRIPPQIGRYSIYIIDEVHMLSAAAFNAFLKTLEEPPSHAVFILATTEKHKIIPTILSRCQIFDFNRIKIDDTVKYLEKISKNESVTYETEGLRIIAQKADGGMRDALSIYDQIVSYCGNHITYRSVIENLNVLDYEYYFRLTDAFLDHNFGQPLMLFNEILDKGFDGHNFIAGLSSHFRDLLVCKDPVTLSLLEVGADTRERYREQAALCSAGFLFEALNICSSCDINYKISKNQRLHVELALLRLCEIGVEKKNSEQVAPVQNKPATTPTVSPKAAPRPTIPSISIKQAMAGQSEPKSAPATESTLPQEEKTTAPPVEPLPKAGNKPVTQDALAAAWNSFANALKSEDARLFSMLTAHTPSLEDETKIVFQISNPLQKDPLQKIQSKLLRHLRAALDNENAEIEIVLAEKDETNKAYTAEDKFAQMSRKNPALLTFKQQFTLDFE